VRVVDLFSGLGGFSEGFLQRGHDVTRYDNDPRFEAVPNTVIRDVFDMTAEDLRGADVVLASPPCQCFSTAAADHYWNGKTPSPAAEEAIRLVKYTVRIIHAAAPTFWVLENPVGRMRWILGPPTRLTHWAAWGLPYYKPTHLWGLLPDMRWPRPTMWTPGAHGEHEGVQENDSQVVKRMRRFYPPEQATTWAIGHLPTRNGEESYASIAPRAVELRSLVPLKFSLALAEACEKGIGQATLQEAER